MQLGVCWKIKICLTLKFNNLTLVPGSSEQCLNLELKKIQTLNNVLRQSC